MADCLEFQSDRNVVFTRCTRKYVKRKLSRYVRRTVPSCEYHIRVMIASAWYPVITLTTRFNSTRLAIRVQSIAVELSGIGSDRSRALRSYTPTRPPRKRIIMIALHRGPHAATRPWPPIRYRWTWSFSIFPIVHSRSKTWITPRTSSLNVPIIAFVVVELTMSTTFQTFNYNCITAGTDSSHRLQYNKAHHASDTT